MNVTILGGGIASISLAFFIQNKKKIKKITILEKDNKTGGLLRSYKFGKIDYDVGPHIIFSKHKDILNLNIKILEININKFRRSNKILFEKKFIKYPFENDLYKLNKEQINYCLNTFLNNPYKNLKNQNMKQFFLSNFGEGITQLYLEPYNRKIWKFDPAYMDTQMVDRIPRPPKEDIIKSSKGIKTEGYKHQLNFYYPATGGIEALFKMYEKKLGPKVEIIKNSKTYKIQKKNKKFLVSIKNKNISSDKLVSTIPLNEFCKYFKSDKKIEQISQELKYNSIYICMIRVKGNMGGSNFAIMIPDKEIIFHRISKLNFFGKNYSYPGETVFQAEVTFKKNDIYDKMLIKDLKSRIIKDLLKINFAKKKLDIKDILIKKFKYAYVVYDVDHRKNVDTILSFYKKKGVDFTGRWGSWEYLNSDQVIHQSKKLSKKI
jgi:protoporphyrinogen oxidase